MRLPDLTMFLRLWTAFPFLITRRVRTCLPIQGGAISDFESWTEEIDGVYVVHLKGDVDTLGRLKLQALLDDAGGRHIVVDLSGVTFLDMNILRLLEASHHRLRKQGRPLVVVAPASMLRRIIEIVEFSREVPVVDSVRAALDRLSS